MKKLMSALVAAVLVLAPVVFATHVGGGSGVSMETEKFAPLVWLCGDRVVEDDSVEPGRLDCGGDTTPGESSAEQQLRCKEMAERLNNYAFEGESVEWDVLVLEKNGIEKLSDVYMSIGSDVGTGNEIQANCKLVSVLHQQESIPKQCNARIGEEDLDYVKYDNTMALYNCEFTVETPSSMHGEYFVEVEAEDLDGMIGMADEVEYWFFNPEIALSISGDIDFGTVRPGTSSYSSGLLVGNDAEAGSGVLLDMFVSGTDFFDPSSSGAKCPFSNVLELENFAYYAVNGAGSTLKDGRRDVEGYVPIEYGAAFNTPLPFYNRNELIQGPAMIGPYYLANVLAPGAEMTLTFRLDLPEPCNGDFTDGQIFFWGEAI
jgi:hypothetical protein